MAAVTPISFHDHAALDALLVRLSALECEVQELRSLLAISQPDPESSMAAVDHGPAGAQPCAQPRDPSGHWTVTCLGGFHLRCAGRFIAPCRIRRGQAILQYLLASPGHAVHTEVLMETFWPDLQPAASSHNLRMAIYALRRSLHGCGPGGNDQTILFRAEHYMLNPALTIEQDISHFKAAAARGLQANVRGDPAATRAALEEARGYYRGAYLPESLYEEWTEPHRTALQEIHLRVLSRLSSIYAAASDWEAAAICYGEILALDPLREDAYRELMRCFATQGRLTDVYRTYRACQRQLLHEMQMAPTRETEVLYQRLVSQRYSETGDVAQ